MADILDILDLEIPGASEISRDSIIHGDRNKKKYVTTKAVKRPEGMHREVFALLCNDNKELPPMLPTDTGKAYKQTKAKLGMRKVRKWVWAPFTNPARKDNAVFHHWKRVSDDTKEYPFAQFNKQVSIPSYSESEYNQFLKSEDWSQAETDHLMDLCQRFDLRFILINDRWDRAAFRDRSVEDLKERYYGICATLSKVKTNPWSNTVTVVNGEKRIYHYDAEHERKRKEQLRRLFDRTQEQIEEEQMLLTELKKIEARKRERERKTQDLQKLISRADGGSAQPVHNTSTVTDGNHFNELRSDLALVLDLKNALASCEFELQALRHQYEALNPGKTLTIPSSICNTSTDSETKPMGEIIDVVGSPGAHNTTI
ncbi:DNA methyltransferase 1-associated protein 1 [Operophtera brumata]|uniref:DNA methyltransferase 1-associated protein 1 n=1 Tax=Operophtera brumata TaxID=104452 RepID=A0A0L7LG69_OPEBR|nr:DNA methyltransferase 1-associated protein 1 [Operophtera brumata]